jgi:ubiquinone/menaquinone biosynthesis C-methylase UbiE
MLTLSNSQKDLISTFFDRASQRGYGNLSYFPVFGKRLVEASQITRDANVLDVGCGRGAVLFHAAARAGERGRVVGIDLSEDMVHQTNSAILKHGLKQAVALQMDSEELQFPDSSFDVALCGFALFFFTDLPRALSEFRRVLKPGGRLAVSTWCVDDDENWAWYEQQRIDYDLTLKLASNALDNANELQNVLAGAGFANVETHIEGYDWVVPNEIAWWEAIWSISTGAALERLEPQIVEKFKSEAFEKMQAIKQRDGFHRLLKANIATGIKPY